MIDLRTKFDPAKLRQPASEEDTIRLEATMGFSFPSEYKELLRVSNGFALPSGLTIYAIEDVSERNQTFEVRTYAPDYFAIGDDSGGRLVLLHKHLPGVWIVDSGSLHPDDMELLDSSLLEWAGKRFR